MKNVLVVLSLTCSVAACATAWADDPLFHVDVFVAGQGGYHTYRIPALEAAPDGSLLAVVEGRKYNAHDPGNPENEIDLLCKRSEDNGRTWSPTQVIEHAGELWSAANPAIAVDRQRGRIWLLYIRCKPSRGSRKARPGTDDARNLARYSDDSGKTWSEPIDLTAASRDMNDPQWRITVTGPGGMIQDSKGRLVAAAWKCEPYGVFAIFSEDHGQTWQRGQIAPNAEGRESNENQLVELADGRILMDYRDQKPPFRWMSESGDGGRTWGPSRPGLPVTRVCCSIERYTLKSAGDDRDRIVWTGPKGPQRSNLVIRLSYDEAQTFPVERKIASGFAAYSDIAVLKDKTIGVLWERAQPLNITFSHVTREYLETE